MINALSAFYIGLSEKIHCIPIEAIHALPPNEDVCSEGNMSNGIYSPPRNQDEKSCIPKSDKSSIPTGDTIPVTFISSEYTDCQIINNEEGTSIFDAKSTNGMNGFIQPLSSGLGVIDDLGLPHLSVNEAQIVPDTDLEHNGVSSPVENEQKDECQLPKYDNAFDELSTCDKKRSNYHMDDNANNICSSDTISTKPGDIKSNVTVSSSDNQTKGTKDNYYSTMSDENNVAESINRQVLMDTSHNPQTEIEVIDELPGNDDDFGDFDAAFAASRRSDNNNSIFSSSKDEFLRSKESTIVNTNIVGDQDPLFDDSDDDFGDFGEIVTPQARPVLSCSEDKLSSALILSSNNTPDTHSTNAILNSVSH